MQRLEVSGAVRPIYGSLGVKGLDIHCRAIDCNYPTLKYISLELRSFFGTIYTIHCSQADVFRRVLYVNLSSFRHHRIISVSEHETLQRSCVMYL